MKTLHTTYFSNLKCIQSGLLLLLFIVTYSCASSTKSTDLQQPKTNHKTFVYKENGKEYTMQLYFLLIYTKGDKSKLTQEQLQVLQKKHLSHLDSLSNAKKISIAGPFDSKPDDQWRGIIIYNTETKEEAESLTQLDPMVQADALRYELKGVWLAKGSTLQ